MSSPLLEVKDLQVTVGEEQKVLLDGLNLTIYPGETHVLMGHNGAGKSTLMSALMGDPRYTVTRGQIIFKGQDVTHEPADVRAKLGMFLSFQTPEEIPGITLENFLRSEMCIRDRLPASPSKCLRSVRSWPSRWKRWAWMRAMPTAI